MMVVLVGKLQKTLIFSHFAKEFFEQVFEFILIEIMGTTEYFNKIQYNGNTEVYHVVNFRSFRCTVFYIDSINNFTPDRSFDSFVLLQQN